MNAALQASSSAQGRIIANQAIIPIKNPLFNVASGYYILGQSKKSGYRYLAVIPANALVQRADMSIESLVSNSVEAEIFVLQDAWIAIKMPRSALEYLSLREGSPIKAIGNISYFELWERLTYGRYSRYFSLPLPKSVTRDLRRRDIGV